MANGLPTTPFDRSTLFISARSPFARRVRLAFLEHGVQFQERVVDLFGPMTPDLSELFELNPIGRVPTLRLPGGGVIIDSTQILHAFYEGTVSKWMPTDLAERFECHRWTGLALGLCDKIVEWFLDSLRPEASRDPDLQEDFRRILERSLTDIEQAVQGRSAIVGNHLTQADLDLGTVLAYIVLRYPRFDQDWRSNFPNCMKYLAELEKRPSFEATRPPPPA